ncbi:unnamed protein product [Thlaspi arvense]|uniref:Pentatricopeptide repeat-containing protein n=1 Tax=Thlaspi arvense TaxID=13288 RepID=A0AAU9RC65_THLAR|nr:unnamed protein product [Thlaspi arvense]
MAFLLRIRTSESLVQNVIQFRVVSTTSSTLTLNSKTSLTSKQKSSRDVLSLLRTEKNPDRILEICRSASLTPDYHVDRIAFSVAVVTLASEKHFAAVSQLLDGFIQNQPYPKSESFAVRTIILYGRANMLDRSLHTFRDLERYEIPRTVKSLNALLFACLMAKDYNEAKRVYLEMPKMYGIEPDLETYNRMIKVFCESGSTSSSYTIVKEMERKWIKPTAASFGLMIAGFYKEEKMRPNSVTYSHLIHGFCSEENLDEALNLFEGMVKSGYKPDSECYFTLIRCLCKEGDFETALILCKESMERNWVPSFSVMKWLVNGLASLSKVEEAKELILLVKEKNFARNVDLWNEVEAELPQ